MRLNLPVTQNEYDYPDAEMLVSMTDSDSHIIHCNPAFVRTSGYSYEELIGQPHNMIRHPDMPAAAFADMWSTIRSGVPWTGMVKNRRKNGDYYWVRANVTPIVEDGRTTGYMSVRTKPSRIEANAAEQLYARLRSEAERGKSTVYLRQGLLKSYGLKGMLQRLQGISLTERLGLGLLTVILATAGVDMLDFSLQYQSWINLGTALATGSIVLAWFHNTIVKPVNETIHFANSVAAGDLTKNLANLREDELGAMVRALNQLNINLRAIVADVRSEAQGVAVETEQIAQGNVDLSDRTESQASSLEQTAAAMDQLTSTVAQTSSVAQQVGTVGEEAHQAAQLGGNVFADVTQTMRAIHSSSQKVSEIIQVIEGIAFQTNILALNAAVEAARAGDQGRGFAVVASEVRALAQRSASASKEIKNLIEASVSEVATGATLVERASGTINDIVQSVSRVNAFMSEITNATSEQASGIAQVNQAVGHLDSVTQQNAALVEEAAASAQGLSARAQTLRKTVEVFRV